MKQISKLIQQLKNNLYRNTILYTILILCVTSISCEKNNDDIIPIDLSDKLENIDKIFFSQIKKSSDVFDKDEIWKSYHFSDYPKYFIFRDKNQKPIRAYVINPVTKLRGAVKIASSEALGLDLYRYDRGLVKANDKLKKGNDYFDFYFPIEGKKYYAQMYSDKTVKDNQNGAYQLAVHEVFHIFQGKNWKENESVIQGEKNYPITKDLLALQILSTKIAEEMPAEKDKAKIENYLKMYVAIRSEEMRIDPTKKMVKNMANEQEKGEGTAKYIETMNSYKVTSNFESVFNGLSTEYIKTKKVVRSHFAFGVWYDTGAAAVYMLKNMGVDVETKIAKGYTPYDIAVEKLKLSDAQKSSALKSAKDEFKWGEILKETQRLISL